MSLFNRNDIISASKEATLQIIAQMNCIAKEVQLSKKAREDFNEKIGFIENNTKKLSLVLSVVGIMKAGKSTLINSIIGAEILPSRGTAMTVIPTYIKHNEDCKGVTYHFKHADTFSTFLSSLQKKGYKHNLESSALTKRINNKNFNLHKELDDLKEIHEQLEVINDICRISMTEPSCHDLVLDCFKQDDDFPTLETCFKSIDDLNAASDISNFIVVDTPGVNEAKLPQLKEIVNKQISRSSALLLVLNYTDLASDADENMRSRIVDEAKSYQDRLIVAVNRFDARDQKSMKKNETIRFVKDELLEQITLDDNYIFPVSARDALLGRQSLDWLESKGRFELSSLEGWQRDFLDNTTSGEWDEDDEDDLETIEDIAETKRHAQKLLKSSKIGAFIDTAINRAYQNAGPDTLIAALSALKFLLTDTLSLTLEADLDSASRTISELKTRVTALENALKTLSDLSYTVNQKLTSWHDGTASIITEYLNEKVSSLKDISSQSEKSSEIKFGTRHKRDAEKKVTEAKENILKSIDGEFNTIDIEIQNKVASSVVAISKELEGEVNAFSKVLTHDALDGFKMTSKALDFIITFDSGSLDSSSYMSEEYKHKIRPREVFGLTLSWLPEFTYEKYTETTYSVNAEELVSSISNMLESSLKMQMATFKEQLMVIVSDYENEIGSLCEIIRHSSITAIKDASDSTEQQEIKKIYYMNQLETLDEITCYAAEIKAGLDEIRGAV